MDNMHKGNFGLLKPRVTGCLQHLNWEPLPIPILNQQLAPSAPFTEHPQNRMNVIKEKDSSTIWLMHRSSSQSSQANKGQKVNTPTNQQQNKNKGGFKANKENEGASFPLIAHEANKWNADIPYTFNNGHEKMVLLQQTTPPEEEVVKVVDEQEQMKLSRTRLEQLFVNKEGHSVAANGQNDYSNMQESQAQPNQPFNKQAGFYHQNSLGYSGSNQFLINGSMASHFGYLEDEELSRYPLLDMRQQLHSGEGVLKKKSKTLKRVQNSTYERHLQWDKARKARIQEMRETLSVNEVEGCTFQPQIQLQPRKSLRGNRNKDQYQSRNKYQEQLERHVNRLTISSLRKEYARQLEALTPGSGMLWSSIQFPTVGIAPNITGLNSPNQDGACSPVECRSRSRSHSMTKSRDGKSGIKSLERPMSPTQGAHNYSKRRHQHYPQTDQVARLLSGQKTVEAMRYKSLHEDLNQSVLSNAQDLNSIVQDQHSLLMLSSVNQSHNSRHQNQPLSPHGRESVTFSERRPSKGQEDPRFYSIQPDRQKDTLPSHNTSRPCIQSSQMRSVRNSSIMGLKSATSLRAIIYLYGICLQT